MAIDEWKGRRGALASGLRVTGSLGLLGRAKAEGLISELKPLIAKAIDAGIWYTASSSGASWRPPASEQEGLTAPK